VVKIGYAYFHANLLKYISFEKGLLGLFHFARNDEKQRRNNKVLAPKPPKPRISAVLNKVFG